MPASTTESAYRSYFFGKGFADLSATIAGAFANNRRDASDLWTRGRDAWVLGDNLIEKLPSAWWVGASLSVRVFGTLTTLGLTVVHVVILSLFFALIYVAFTGVLAFERILMLVRGFVSVCPHCHTRLPLPVYRCDSCTRTHSRLIPSSFGILFHRCKCGAKLPCTVFTNRGRLQSQCPTCGNMLSREHTETRKQFLPIIGGPQVGKSAYLFALTRELRDSVAPRLGMHGSFVSPDQERAYNAVIAGIDHGVPPEKTVQTLPRAFDLLFRGPGRPDLTLYLYDPAGEAFQRSDELIPHRFLDYPSGILFLIDPFSIPEVRARYAEQLKRNRNISPSSFPPDELLSRLINVLEGQFGLSSTAKIRVPMAVVLTKIDAFRLEEEIGEAALGASGATTADKTEQARRNRLIKQRLREWDEGGFVHRLEARFKTVNFYTASALGRTPDEARHDPFAPKRIMEPVLWLLGRSNALWAGKPARPRAEWFVRGLSTPAGLTAGVAALAAAASIGVGAIILQRGSPGAQEPADDRAETVVYGRFGAGQARSESAAQPHAAVAPQPAPPRPKAASSGPAQDTPAPSPARPAAPPTLMERPQPASPTPPAPSLPRQPLPTAEECCRLFVKTDPADAQVRIMNISPKYYPGIRPGKDVVDILVEHKDFVPKRMEVVMTDPRQDVWIRLEPKFHYLTVEPTPSHARVRVMNVVPPYEDQMRLPAFRHYDVLVSAPGYQDLRRDIFLDEYDKRVPVVLQSR
jgi:hypothetical protein